MTNTKCFNSRDPCGSRLKGELLSEYRKLVSTHATRAGRDRSPLRTSRALSGFNSRDPCGSRLDDIGLHEYTFDVSTHATRAGRDLGNGNVRITTNVSTHATRAGRDGLLGRCPSPQYLFQLTRPVRVATSSRHLELSMSEVSTHATRAGRDLAWAGLSGTGYFVSTHATRAGRDFAGRSVVIYSQSFNSRDPCGSRPTWVGRMGSMDAFQLTRPVRVATSIARGMGKKHVFQLTRPVRVATAWKFFVRLY